MGSTNILVSRVSKTSVSGQKQKITSGLLICVSILLLALVVLVGYFAFCEAGYRSSGYYRNYIKEFPFRCEDFSLSPDEDFETFDIKANTFKYFVQGNRYICSFRNLTDVLQKFLERIGRIRLSKGLDSHQYSQCGNVSLKQPSGHLSVSFTKLSRHQHYTDQGLYHTVHWDRRPENSYIAENLDYHKGEVRVPEGRFYYTYASVHINVSRTIASTTRVSLRICASKRGHERTLIYKGNVYDTTDKNIVSSLNVGSHVFLSKDEKVYVKVSDAEGLIRESAGNTFGIFPLH